MTVDHILTWVFLTDSTDGWDFSTGAENLLPPSIKISAELPVPTPLLPGEFNLNANAEIRSNRVDDQTGSETSVTENQSDGGEPASLNIWSRRSPSGLVLQV